MRQPHEAHNNEAKMNKSRNTITTAVLLSLTGIAPASALMRITYQISQNETFGSTIFFGTFIADLIGVYWWASRQLAPAT